MGKVRRQRQKFHLAAKSKSTNDLTEISDNSLQDTSNLNATDSDLFKSSDNIFSGINIKHENLFKNLPQDFDVRSVVSSKSRKELKEEEQHLKKKEKLKLRRERFLKKIDIIKQTIKESKERKKRQKTVIVGDMQPLADALPSLESLAVNKNRKESLKLKKKPKGVLKLKQRQKQQSADVKMFKKILNDKVFKSNPTETISEFLKQKVMKERPNINI